MSFQQLKVLLKMLLQSFLNIKKISLKIYSDEEKTIEIDVQGEGSRDCC